MIRFETTHGNFTVELFDKDAPLTVANFYAYVDNGFFDGTIFHRIVPGFVIQGGGLDAEFDQKQTKPPVKNEGDNGLRNERGTLSMARTDAPHSATSQFFVNLADNEFLDHKPGQLRLRGVRSRRRWDRSHRQDRGGEDWPAQRLHGCAHGGCDHHLRASNWRQGRLTY